jgi:hypothetical protein
LIAAIDLDSYDFSPTSRSLIRATEGTISERIPPRTRVRRGAPLELPHVLVLYADPKNTVLHSISPEERQLSPLYDFDLMNDGGHVSGYHVTDEGAIRTVLESFERLADPVDFEQRYRSKDVLLFAVGDGNHSLAAAKTVWEETKRTLPTEAIVGHPGRYALVELINIYDPGLHFEAIHRVVFATGEDFLAEVTHKPDTRLTPVATFDEMLALVGDQSGGQRFGVASADGFSVVAFTEPVSSLAAGSLQPLLDDFARQNPRTRIDYIHGEESTRRLGQTSGNLGLFLPVISKADFFHTIVNDGTFPRKTFSMGEASDKRFYLEARSIVSDT